MRSRSSLLAALMLLSVILVGFLTYHAMLGYFFTGTDALTLIDTARVDSLDDVGRILTEPLMGGSKFTNEFLYYRPVSVLSFSLDYSLWGMNPFGYHVTDLILHLVVASLVFLLVYTLGGGRLWLAWLAALLFTTHPILVEVVPATARRQDTLAVLWLLLSLLFFTGYLNARRPKAMLAASLVCYLFALGSKEIAVVLPFVVLTLSVVNAWPAPSGRKVDDWLKDRARPTAGYFFLTAAFVAWRTYVLGGFGGASDGTRPPTSIFSTSGQYYEALLDPAGVIGQNAMSVAAVVGYTLALFLIYRNGIQRARTGSGAGGTGRLLVFLFAWLTLPLLLYDITATFDVRGMYIAAIPFSIILAILLSEAARAVVRALKQGRLRPALAGAAATMGLGIIAIGLVAHSPLLRRYSDWEANGRLASMFLERLSSFVPGIPSEAVLKIRGLPLRVWADGIGDSTVRRPGTLMEWTVESWLHLEHPGVADRVELLFRTMPRVVPSGINLQSDVRDSVVTLLVRLELPDSADDVTEYKDLGREHFNDRDYSCAIGCLERYTRSVDDDVAGWNYLGEAYFKAGVTDSAAAKFRHSLMLRDRDNEDAYSYLFRILISEKAYGVAEDLCGAWLAREPDNYLVYRGLGNLARQQGKHGDAGVYFGMSRILEEASTVHSEHGDL